MKTIQEQLIEKASKELAREIDEYIARLLYCLGEYLAGDREDRKFYKRYIKRNYLEDTPFLLREIEFRKLLKKFKNRINK